MKNQAKLNNKLDYLGVLIDNLLVLGKNLCSLAAKLWKIYKIYVTGLLSHLSLAVALLYVNTSNLKTYVYFVIAGFWGMGDAIWSTNFSGECRVVLPILLHGGIIKNTLLYQNFLCVLFY